MASSSGSDDDDSAKGKINEWQESSQVLYIFHFDCIYLCGEHSGVVYGLKTAILYNLIILEYNNLNSSLYNSRQALNIAVLVGLCRFTI